MAIESLDIFSMPDDSYLQISAVMAIVKMNREAITEAVQSETFPSPAKINTLGIELWIAGDIKLWVLAQNTIDTPSV